MKLKKIFLILIGFCCNVSLTGCELVFEYEFGDYFLRTKADVYVFAGLTESGKEKEILILPESYEGKSIIFPYQSMFNGFNLQNGKFKKMFIPAVYDSYPNGTRISSLYKDYKIFMLCAKYENLISEHAEFCDDRVYLPSKYKDYQNANITLKFEVANVSYYYNYEGAPNNNYYWIDDESYGNKLSYIPPNPVRDGYIFSGWYKEKECINQWNYKEDTLPYVSINNDKIVYQETSLFAKWTAITPYIRNTVFTITDDDIWEQSHDEISIKELTGYSAQELIDQDYTKITIKIDLRMWEVNNGYQYLFIYNGTNDTYKCFDWKEYEHGGQSKDKEKKYIDSIFLEIDLADLVIDDKLYVYYGANGIGSDNWSNDSFTAKWYSAEQK